VKLPWFVQSKVTENKLFCDSLQLPDAYAAELWLLKTIPNTGEECAEPL
jgi:hypothetical protein